jgi:hypothetical protein
MMMNKCDLPRYSDSICAQCAETKGWKEHSEGGNTWWEDVCTVCETVQGVCSTTDYKKPRHMEGRD